MWAKVGNTLIHLAYVRYVEYIPAGNVDGEDEEDDEEDVDGEDEADYEDEEEEDELTISFSENPTEDTIFLTFHGADAKEGFEKISKLIENAV